jgi:RHS repeat-associated protein
VRRYQAGPTLTDITRNGFYAPSTLTTTLTTDELNNPVTDFVDKDGRLVLRRAGRNEQTLTNTYYVYDDLNQLRAVLQPLYDKQTSPTAADLTKYAFLYGYDGRGRLTSKQVPGGGTITMDYDARDLLTRVTDARGYVVNTAYDALNRPIRTYNQQGQDLSFTFYDNYEAALPIGGTLWSTFTFQRDGSTYPWTSGSDFVPADLRYAGRQGQVTGQCQRLLNADGTLSGQWNCQATYYDNRYRVVQTIRNLPMGSNGREKVSYLRDFAGKVVGEKTTQSWDAQTYTLEKLFSYDQAERLTSTRYRTSGGLPAKDIYVNVLGYNEVGQLRDKFLHASDASGSGVIERLSYKHDVRGWLREHKGVAKVNRPFNLTLGYQANGNVGSLGWQYPTGGQQGTYQYSYDELNRLLSGRMDNGTGTGETISYDYNGNIGSLNRYQGSSQIDQLQYTYSDHSSGLYGNRLRGIRDQSGNPAGLNDANSTDDDYRYDAAGNLLEDRNRGATISYNYLNLPAQVSVNGRTLGYTYDAGGQKHGMNVGGGANTLYEGIFEYDGAGNPSRIQTDEGQLVKVGSTWQWQYYLKDHLGNVRVVLDEAGQVVQETDYHPFGLAIPKNPGDMVQSQARNKYLYLNREQQVETGWLDLKARYYDPLTGRFTTVDPLTDQQEQLTPYHYGYNNPLRYSDPNGKCPDCPENDPFLFARLAVTAFYDTKHAIENTILRAVGSDTRVGYKVVDGQQVFETTAYKQTPINSVGTAAREIASAALDVASIAGVKSGGVTGSLLSKTSQSQVNRAVKDVINETVKGGGNLTSKYTLTESQALEAGVNFAGGNAKEIGKTGSGVYRSQNVNSDGTVNQFRIDANSIQGKHAPNVPHVHLEVIDPKKVKPVVNNHIPIK